MMWHDSKFLATKNRTTLGGRVSHAIFFWQGSNTVFFGLHFIGIVRDALRVASGFIFCSDLNVI